MTGLTSIRTSADSKIEIVDQLLLPHTTEFIEIDNIEQAHDAIKSMKVVHPPFVPIGVLNGEVDPRGACHSLSSGIVHFRSSYPRFTGVTSSGLSFLA
jgi:hypothetical protein